MKVFILSIKISRKILALSFLALLIPVLIIPANSESGDVFYANNYTTNGSDNFVEDFTTTTYKDGISTIVGWGDGVLTAERNFSWDWLDLYMTVNPITDVAVQGRKAYAACFNPNAGISTMASFDIDEPNNIIRLSDDDSTTGPYTITVVGDVLYLGYAAGTLRVNTYNVSNPYLSSVAKYMGSTYANGRVTDVEADGHLLYYASYDDSGDDSFRIVDASDPNAMVEISSNWVSNKTLGLYVEYPIAYLAESDDGLYIVNTTVKTSTYEIGYLDTPGNATDVLVDGAFAYIADGPAGVHVVDIRDPTNPEIMGTYDTPGNARRLALQGNTLFVADGSGGVIVLDVADPYHPIFVAQKYPFPFGDANDVDLYGGILVVGADLGLYTYEIAAIGGGITNISNYAFQNPYSGHKAYDVRVRGDIAYVVGGDDGLYTLNIRDPNYPILLDQDVQGTGRSYRKLEIRGDFAYIADYGVGGGFRIYDISDPTNIFQTDIDGLSFCSDVALSGDFAYIPDGTFGIFIYDISNPYNINYQYSYGGGTMTNVTAVWIQGPHLYACEWIGSGSSSCVYVLDITDPSDIKECYVRFRFNYNYDVFVDGDLLYLGGEDDGNGMWIYNVSNPYSMVISDNVLPIDSHGVWGFGPYVLSANMQDGVSIINATNPLNIVTGSTYADATSALQITTKGDYTYVANQESLVILRHFLSAGDTYIPGSFIAQSLEVDSETNVQIKFATLTPIDFVPPGTQIDYFMSADGGAHWEAVTPGIEHEFVNVGEDLRWKAEFIGPEYRSAHLYHIEINYEFNEAPSIPSLADIGDKTFGTFKVDWSDSTDDVAVDHYILQMSDTLSFTTLLKEWTTTKSSKTVMIGKGSFYFRVQAVDDEGLLSEWSLAKSATVNLSTAILGIIVGGGAVVLILAILIPVLLVRRKKKIPTR
ncbi:MAG: hypothetical protein FK730_14155 [Asgard group archaeon]|nr:hypothetical protein [Asgard group archaeon]